MQLDSVAVSNILSRSFEDRILVFVEVINKRITLTSGVKSSGLGFLTVDPVSFGDLRVPLRCFIVGGSPLGIIIGYPALEDLGAILDLCKMAVYLTLDGKTVRVPLIHE